MIMKIKLQKKLKWEKKEVRSGRKEKKEVRSGREGKRN